MKTWKKIGLGILFAIIVACIWFYPTYKRLMHTIHLFDEDQIVENFQSMDQHYPVSYLKASTLPFKYPIGNSVELPESFSYNDQNYDSKKFLKDSWTTGFIVLQEDSVVFEEYYLGYSESTSSISWSMAKSFVSALMGIAIEEGHIKSIEQNVEDYVPELIGSSYEGVRIKDVLQMSTGVLFDEDYGDFNSDINRWGRGFALGNSQDEFAGTLEREKEPGIENHYVSINTHVLGMILTRATGESITNYMQKKLFDPMGMEFDGYWLVDSEGMEVALGGLNLTLRDFVKIGTLFLNEGVWEGKQIVPKDWVISSVTPDGPHVQPGDEFGYGYQWWIPSGDAREFMAIGIYNQNIYINPTTKTVVAKLSANPNYNDPDFVPSSHYSALELYRSIAKEIGNIGSDSLSIETSN